MSTTSAVPARDVIRAIAFVGDLAMGQPTDHSWRTAWLARQLAQATGGNEAHCAQAAIVASLRWSGCTANAHEFARAFGDDVALRESLLSTQDPEGGLKIGVQNRPAAFFSLSRIHCEVAGDIAALLSLDEDVQYALRHLFENYDGSGAPGGLSHDEVPRFVYLTAMASDLEILHRLYGLERACALVRLRADRQYPADLVDTAVANARAWFTELATRRTTEDIDVLRGDALEQGVPLEVLADVIDLKLPWMTGHSRLAAALARDAAEQLGLEPSVQHLLYRAALIHGMGRTAIPNMIWETPSALSESAWERVRLAPYWTSRAGRLLPSLRKEAELASLAYERSDGSGYYRGLTADDVPLEGRILAAAVARAALGRPRPWRSAYPANQVRELLFEEARQGRLDGPAVRALLSQTPRRSSHPATPAVTKLYVLTDREKEVLRCISLGASNKAVALKLSISTSTVRTHVESVFRKLQCTTRAAAILKAVQLGLLDPVELQ
ncbi:HD domain-containing phosphohydrolase [Dyella sp. C9]|uniref:HD domain-containing phosphohydrolase n=1 Tax=Dyella sp. C9 TaxID=2202154 RepID=UPI000DEEEB9B|nr:HD domain-containing phosphohydrolase [Dyella sp. C9]